MWEPDMDRIIQTVESAPSIFNSKPWSLHQVAKDRIELHAKQVILYGEDQENSDIWLHVDKRGFYLDPLAREFAISCGAALFNLRLAIRVAGHDLNVWLLPDHTHDSTLLASAEIVIGRIKPPTTAEQELYEAIWRRHTNRWPYTIIPAPLPIITAMEDAAAREGASLRLLHKRQARRWMHVADDADRYLETKPEDLPQTTDERHQQTTDKRYQLYQEERDRLMPGVPRYRFGPTPEKHFRRIRKENHYPRTRKDFWLGEKKRHFERKPQLMALSTEDDQLLDWLRAGQALQRAILTGTRYSMSTPYGLAAKYHAPRRYGVPARHHLLTRHDHLAHYGLSVSFLTQALECYDIEHPLKRADEELERTDEEGDRIHAEPRHRPWRTAEPRHWPLRWRWRFPELPQMVMRVGYTDHLDEVGDPSPVIDLPR